MTYPKYDLSGTTRDALLAVYALGALDQPVDVGRIARVLGLSAGETVCALRKLDQQGLLWAERCRLTMHGLVIAARIACTQSRSAQHAA